MITSIYHSPYMAEPAEKATTSSAIRVGIGFRKTPWEGFPGGTLRVDFIPAQGGKILQIHLQEGFNTFFVDRVIQCLYKVLPSCYFLYDFAG
jgi:hypothetical protein